ncbi:MAG TPA: ABC transporter ATP-binding protein [Blastocatellia bacterium]|nr:ABC transporter ATP-binding protein [Blastocatellia bacterium]
MIDLRFNRVSKKYRIQQHDDGRARLNPLARRLKNLLSRRQDFWALRDVSFEVTRGETLGIIGPNGAGKSTILKLLSRITAPTSGEIVINGRLSAMIEIGSGFHPELTGRENIYLNGSILGMRRREIAEKLDRIIEFAGVAEFIDTPVKHYSSGMYVRLGFSIAAHLNPHILLLDEVLAVGDASFQVKCLQRVSELRQRGTTIVFISHDLAAVERLCDRALLLNHGRIIAMGLPREVIAEYRRIAYGDTPPEQMSAEIDFKPVEIMNLSLYDSQERPTTNFFTGKPFSARVEYVAHERVVDAAFELFCYSHDGAYIHCQFTTAQDGKRITLEPGAGAVEFHCSELGLQPGVYTIGAAVKERAASRNIDWRYGDKMLHVEEGKYVRGSFYLPHDWRIHQSTDARTKQQAIR